MNVGGVEARKGIADSSDYVSTFHEAIQLKEELVRKISSVDFRCSDEELLRLGKDLRGVNKKIKIHCGIPC